MRSKTESAVLKRVYSIALKTRMLQEWDRLHRPLASGRYSERQVFMLELIQGFEPITRRDLGIIFNLSAAAVTADVKPLVDDGLLVESRTKDDRREKPLEIGSKGKTFMEEVSENAARRFAYLFDGVTTQQWEALMDILNKVDQAAKKRVDRTVFGRQ